MCRTRGAVKLDRGRIKVRHGQRPRTALLFTLRQSITTRLAPKNVACTLQNRTVPKRMVCSRTGEPIHRVSRRSETSTCLNLRDHRHPIGRREVVTFQQLNFARVRTREHQSALRNTTPPEKKLHTSQQKEPTTTKERTTFCGATREQLPP